jgi:hypothetical protein
MSKAAQFVGVLDFHRNNPWSKEWTLDAPLGYITGRPDEEMIVAPAGFTTDGASIPWWGWLIVGPPMTGRYVEAAVIHDFLYVNHDYSRARSDEIFLEAMKVCQVTKWKRRLMYRALRIARKASKIYHSHDEEPQNIGGNNDD